MYQYIRATSNSLAQFLRDQLTADPVLQADFTDGGLMVVNLSNPQEMNDIDRRGISMWLYRVVRDDQRLNAPRERLTPRSQSRHELPLRLHYLVTPIAQVTAEASPETEQVLMGKVLQVFHDHPVLSDSDFVEELAGTDLRLHVRLETLSLEEITRVWESLERSYQLCVSYEVSVVPISSGTEPDSMTPIGESAPEHAVIVNVN